jgi:hypothetical protein
VWYGTYGTGTTVEKNVDYYTNIIFYESHYFFHAISSNHYRHHTMTFDITMVVYRDALSLTTLQAAKSQT